MLANLTLRANELSAVAKLRVSALPNENLDRFFVVLRQENGELKGHAVVFDESRINQLHPPAAEARQDAKPIVADANTFHEVFDAFETVISTYRNFLAFTMAVAPALSNKIAQRTIRDFAKAKGKHRSDLSTDAHIVYEMEMNAYRQFQTHDGDIEAAMTGARLLPEVMLIGLVSAYDSFLGKLLRVIINKQENIVLTSEKSIKFSELSSFKSIEEARNSIIDREIEAVLRESHQEHFTWMERKFSMNLRSDLPVFPSFIELCERRNLLTHTGGIVSSKYIENCKTSKASTGNVQIGQKLTVDTEYYSAAVDVVCEIAIKLCWVLWRKFSKDERSEADKRLSEFCYELIVRRHYKAAEAILSFSAKILQKGGNDSCRRMMLVNLANAIRLQERQADANKILDGEDWSAVNNEFAVAVAAVKSDMDTVVSLMVRIGSNGCPNLEDYRSWPVFRGLRSHARFSAAIQDIFGVPLVLVEAKPEAKLSPEAPQPSADGGLGSQADSNQTKH